MSIWRSSPWRISPTTTSHGVRRRKSNKKGKFSRLPHQMMYRTHPWPSQRKIVMTKSTSNSSKIHKPAHKRINYSNTVNTSRMKTNSINHKSVPLGNGFTNSNQPKTTYKSIQNFPSTSLQSQNNLPKHRLLLMLRLCWRRDNKYNNLLIPTWVPVNKNQWQKEWRR